MSETTPAKPIGTRSPVKLRPLPRWVLGILGLAGMGGGSVAVFTQDVEAGPVAMIGIGAFFFVIGLLGLMPTRLKIGDNEAEWLQEVGAEVAAVADLVPQYSRVELMASLARLVRVSPEAASPAMAGVAYEELVVGLLTLAIDSINKDLPESQKVRLTPQQRYPDVQFDAVLEQGTTRVIGVETKAYSRDIPRQLIHEMLGRASAWQPGSETTRVLLVTRTKLTQGAELVLEATAGELEHVVVGGMEDLPFLVKAVRRCLA